MPCNRNSECLNIANTIYPNLNLEVSTSLKQAVHYISSAMTKLNGMNIPDDSLGVKIKQIISSNNTKLEQDCNNIEKVISNVDGFVKSKVEEHKEHYRAWEEQQAAMRRKRQQREELEREK